MGEKNFVRNFPCAPCLFHTAPPVTFFFLYCNTCTLINTFRFIFKCRGLLSRWTERHFRMDKNIWEMAFLKGNTFISFILVQNLYLLQVNPLLHTCDVCSPTEPRGGTEQCGRYREDDSNFSVLQNILNSFGSLQSAAVSQHVHARQRDIALDLLISRT